MSKRHFCSKSTHFPVFMVISASCSQIRAGNASWHSQCSTEQDEQLHTELSQAWRSLSLCTLCLTNKAILLWGLKPALGATQRLLELHGGRRLPRPQGSCVTAAEHTWACVDADDPCQAVPGLVCTPVAKFSFQTEKSSGGRAVCSPPNSL